MLFINNQCDVDKKRRFETIRNERRFLCICSKDKEAHLINRARVGNFCEAENIFTLS